MPHQTFKLVSTYEHVPESFQYEELFRIEIFQNTESHDQWRCRVWSYRYYAVRLAIPSPPLESHDLLGHEVTFMLNDEELITGIAGASEEVVLQRAISGIAKLGKVTNG